jgi:hypothetical protein
MAPVPTPPLPGSMTVPPLFGWEDILTVLSFLIGLAVLFFLASAAGRSVDGRSEWQAGLDARSRERRLPDDGSDDAPAEPLRTDRQT